MVEKCADSKGNRDFSHLSTCMEHLTHNQFPCSPFCSLYVLLFAHSAALKLSPVNLCRRKCSREARFLREPRSRHVNQSDRDEAGE